jgi:hypothetical protein
MQKIRSIKQLERIIGSRKPAPENGEFVCRIFCPETQEVVILSPRPGSQAYLDFFRIQEEGNPFLSHPQRSSSEQKKVSGRHAGRYSPSFETTFILRASRDSCLLLETQNSSPRKWPPSYTLINSWPPIY